MNSKIFLTTTLALGVAFTPSAYAKDKKKPSPRGIIESMQSLPCGVKERGIAGVGGMVASLGVTHINSNEKLCPQYLFRTDDMEYHLRAMKTKNDPLLPLGQEAEFKIKKDRLYLKVVDSKGKARPYQVVSMEQIGTASKMENTQYHPPAPESRPPDSRSSMTDSRTAERQAPPVANRQATVPPPQ